MSSTILLDIFETRIEFTGLTSGKSCCLYTYRRIKTLHSCFSPNRKIQVFSRFERKTATGINYKSTIRLTLVVIRVHSVHGIAQYSGLGLFKLFVRHVPLPAVNR